MKKIYAFLGSLLLATAAFGATFNLFTPATGVLKGNASTYVTTAAASTDIYSLWSGTCNSTTYLRGDGQCQAPPGAGGGTVNSVGLSAPSIFSVGGSPVTTTGTLALTFAGGQTANQFLASPDGTTGAITLRSMVAADVPTLDLVTKTSTTVTGLLKGTGSGAPSTYAGTSCTNQFPRSLNASGVATCASVSMTADVTGITPAANGGTANGFTAFSGPATSTKTFTLPNASATVLTDNAVVTVAQGGTGVTTLTGIAKGSGTSAFTAAASSDVISTWGGSCSASTYLRGDGSCQTPPTGGTSANPSATIGLTAVNGAAGTFLRSDGAPALSQAIAPTWTGVHSFSGTGVRMTFIGAGTSGQYLSMANTAGSGILGIEDSVGGFLLSGTSSYSTSIGTLNATELALGTNGATRLKIGTTGSVTLTATSGDVLTVGGSIRSNGTQLNVYPGSSIDYELVNRNGRGINFYTNSAGVLAFNFGPSGQLGIGGATYGTSGQVLTSGGPSAAPSWTTLASASSGSFTATATGMSGATTGTLKYNLSNGIVVLYADGTALSGTSNTTGLTITGLPAAIQPANQRTVLTYSTNNGTSTVSQADVLSGTVTFSLCSSLTACSASGYTSSGAKGVSLAWSITYPL